MFQTDLIVQLQSLSSGFLDLIMQVISFLGDGDTLPVLLLAFMFGVHLRAGFIMFQAWIWAVTLNGVLKAHLRFPRPFDINGKVRSPGITDSAAPAISFNPGGFFALPPGGTNPSAGFGFPSGHCAGTAAWAGALATLVRRPIARILLGVWILLMAFSRLYLGRHFPADVLAGTLIGLAVAMTAVGTMGRSPTLQWWLEERFQRFRAEWRRPLVIFAALAGPLIILFIPRAYATASARLLGLNLGFLFSWWRGLPREGGSPSRRLVRAALGVLIYSIIFNGPALIIGNSVMPAWLDILRHFLAPFTALAAGIHLAVKFGAWSR